jgi:hypothetical protein
MFEVNLLLTIFLLCFFSIFDFIIFNEEVLLTLCFLCFLFYCFNTLSDSVFGTFESRAAKFELDLLQSFNTTKTSLVYDFNGFLSLQAFYDKFMILLLILSNFLNQCLFFLETKPSVIFYQACLTKLNELLVINKNFTSIFQKTCVIQLLYSLILKKATNDLTFLVSAKKIKTKFSSLKILCLV